MLGKTRPWTAAFFTFSLALAGCMKAGEDSTGVRPDPSSGLDAVHGGARIVLPDIDPAALGKAGADTAVSAWFELVISGDNMKDMPFRFPIPNPGGRTLEINGIPAGKGRQFHGSLLNANRVVTHEGITRADIKAGAVANVQLYLAKAAGSAAVCVVIEGQKLPPCATADTMPPPPKPRPVPDSAAIGGCWFVSSAWLSGRVTLFDSAVNGSSGAFHRDSGADLQFTTWARRGDSLLAILISPNPEEKWLFRGIVLGKNEAWTGILSNYVTGKTTAFGAKPLPCSVKTDTGKVPSDTVPPKPNPGTGGSIPMPGSGAMQTTLCFEMRFDYGNAACETQGYAKMEFLDGKIPYGNLVVADMPARDYLVSGGRYDSAAISFYGVTQPGSSVSRDTLSLQGYIGAGATMAKGDYLRLPSGKKGIWTMKAVTCGSWTPKYPDPSCSAKGP